jgi:outer membrane protein TolC
MRQRRLELRQAANQLQVTIASIRNEVEIASREVHTTHRELLSKSQAMTASEGEVQYLRDRWQLLPGDQQVTGVVLHDLLNAQERLADAEMGYARSLVEYNVALINLKRCTGTLLQYEQIVEYQTDENGVPKLNLGKPTPSQDAYGEPSPVPPPAGSPDLGSTPGRLSPLR